MVEPMLFHKPRRIWVDDGHVYAEGSDGAILRMEPEVAIELGRQLEQAGTESFINKVMDGKVTMATMATIGADEHGTG